MPSSWYRLVFFFFFCWPKSFAIISFSLSILIYVYKYKVAAGKCLCVWMSESAARPNLVYSLPTMAFLCNWKKKCGSIEVKNHWNIETSKWIYIIVHAIAFNAGYFDFACLRFDWSIGSSIRWSTGCQTNTKRWRKSKTFHWIQVNFAFYDWNELITNVRKKNWKKLHEKTLNK